MKFLYGIILLLTLALPKIAEAQFAYPDCDTVPVASRETNLTTCRQGTTANGRIAGFEYLWNGSAWVQDAIPPREFSFDNLPVSPPGNPVFRVIDCLTDACVAGGGSIRKLVEWTGSVYALLGDGATGVTGASGVPYDNTDSGLGGDNVQSALDELAQINLITETDTLQSTFSRGPHITGATSQLTAFGVGSATRQWRLFDDSVDGLQLMCWINSTLNDCDYVRSLNPGKFWGLRDSLANLFVKFDEATGKLSWPTASKRPRRSIGFDADNARVSGNCVLSDATIPAGGYPKGYIKCVDTTGDEFTLGWVMRDGWDAGPITIKVVAINSNAAPTGTFTLAVNGHCTRDGDPRPVMNTTNAVNVSFTSWAAQYAEEHVTSGEITLQGTCAKGSSIDLRVRVTVVPAQVADVHISKFLVEYREDEYGD